METPDIDAQDVAEVFDEDNTNIEADRTGRHDDGEQVEDLVDVFDSTRAVGDADDGDAEIGEDMDDDDVVDASTGQDGMDEPTDVGAADDDDVDAVGAKASSEVDLVYAGDLTNSAAASSAAADMESDELSDDDLEDLDYKKDEPA